MKSINNLVVTDLIPQSIKNDKVVQALAAAYQNEIDQIIAKTEKIIFLPNITTIDNDVLEHLANNWGMNAEDGWGIVEIDSSLTRQKKEQLVQLSWELQRHKGTKYALEKIISLVGLIGKVEVWWEYGGAPYNFKITITGATNYQPWQIDLLSKLVLQYQSVRDNGELYVEFDYLTWYWAQACHITSISDSVFIVPKHRHSYKHMNWFTYKLDNCIPINKLLHSKLKHKFRSGSIFQINASKSHPINHIH